MASAQAKAMANLGDQAMEIYETWCKEAAHNNRLEEATIMIEAAKAYASWCEVMPRDSQSLSTPFTTLEIYQEQIEDLEKNEQWLTTYTTSMKENQWWTMRSEAEIFELLAILPLNDESFSEIQELMKAIRVTYVRCRK